MRWPWSKPKIGEVYYVEPKPEVSLTTTNTNYDTVAWEWHLRTQRRSLEATLKGAKARLAVSDFDMETSRYYYGTSSVSTTIDTDQLRAWCEAVIAAIDESAA